jgi:hypothetical protein
MNEYSITKDGGLLLLPKNLTTLLLGFLPNEPTRFDLERVKVESGTLIASDGRGMVVVETDCKIDDSMNVLSCSGHLMPIQCEKGFPDWKSLFPDMDGYEEVPLNDLGLYKDYSSIVMGIFHSGSAICLDLFGERIRNLIDCCGDSIKLYISKKDTLGDAVLLKGLLLGGQDHEITMFIMPVNIR